jgi:hypothetical protein
MLLTVSRGSPDYKTGFGGKFGVQSERQDSSAVGFDYKERLAKHESQQGTVPPHPHPPTSPCSAADLEQTSGFTAVPVTVPCAASCQRWPPLKCHARATSRSLVLFLPHPTPVLFFPPAFWVEVRRHSAGQVGIVSAGNTSGLIAADPQR